MNNNTVHISRSGSISKGKPIAIIDISAENRTFKRIRAGSTNAKGQKYLAVIYEIEGVDYLDEK